MKYLLLILTMMVGVAQADTIINLETPVDGSTAQGVDTIRGWAVSDEGLTKIELYIDGEYVFDLPLGGQRQDVANVFPDYPGSLDSGFSAAFYYGLLDPEVAHTMTVIALDGDDNELTSDMIEFDTVRLEPDTWQKQSYTGQVRCHANAGRTGFNLRNAWLNDVNYDRIEFQWFDAVQGYRIVDISEGRGPAEPPRPPQPPVPPPYPPCTDCEPEPEPEPEPEGDCRAHQASTGNCGNGEGDGGGNGNDDEGLGN